MKTNSVTCNTAQKTTLTEQQLTKQLELIARDKKMANTLLTQMLNSIQSSSVSYITKGKNNYG